MSAEVSSSVASYAQSFPDSVREISVVQYRKRLNALECIRSFFLIMCSAA